MARRIASAGVAPSMRCGGSRDRNGSPAYGGSGATGRVDQPGLTRDYYRVEDARGRRFWVFRHGLYDEKPDPGWYLHGLFA